MQESQISTDSAGTHPTGQPADSATPSRVPGEYRVIRRNGKVTEHDPDKIAVAMTKAFLAVEGGRAAASARIHDEVRKLARAVDHALKRRQPGGGTFHIEDIQDQVELALMRAGHHKVARAYVLYREERARERAESHPAEDEEEKASHLHVTLADGSQRPLNIERIRAIVEEACEDVADVAPEPIVEETLRNLYDGATENEVAETLVMAARTLIEQEPDHTYVAARLLLDQLRTEVLTFLDLEPFQATQSEMPGRYPQAFKATIHKGIDLELLDPELAGFDLDRLGEALIADRDRQFTYLGLQTLYDRYFIKHETTRLELPQVFFMRVAMGLAINEDDREHWAIEFYRLLSSFDFMSSTPTLFNSATQRPQLSSCYLTTVPDDLDGIYSAVRDNALLSKFAGGLGNDWTRIRAMGAHIKGTNGKSQGVVPFLKVANDTAVAVNQCFAPDTHVFTAEGIRAIEDIRIGDLVIGQRGQYREVLDHMTYDQNDPMVEVRAKHSIRNLRVTAGHPLWAIKGVPMEQAGERTARWLDKGKVAPEWIEAGELEAGDYVAQVIPRETVPVQGLEDDDARLYGILLGCGHLSKNASQWGVSGNPRTDTHLQFVREYLESRGIHYWETGRGDTYLQIHWAAGRGADRKSVV